MAIDPACGENEDLDDEIITPIIGGDRATPEQEDFDGLELLLAEIDGAYWPIHQCGNTGLGTEFDGGDDMPSDGAGCRSVQDVDLDEVTAHACILGCDYFIDADTLTSRVIMGKIDGQWNILRVLDSPVVSKSTLTCQCCRLYKSPLLAEIIDSTGGDCGDLVGRTFPLTADDAELRGWNGSIEWECDSTPRTLEVTLECLADQNSEVEDIEDWSVSLACGEQNSSGTVDSLTCGAEEDVDGYNEGFELVFSTGALPGCCDCELTIRVTQAPNDNECFEQELIEEVVMEACGLPELQPGEPVIMAKVTQASGEVKWFLVRACSSWEGCDNPCNPPPEDEPLCCGVVCSENPATLTATIEITSGDSCDCATNDEVTLTRDTCAGEIANVTYSNATPPSDICPDATGDAPTAINLSAILLTCNASAAACPDEDADIYTLELNNYPGAFTLNRETACCDPLFLEFDSTLIDACEGDPMQNPAVTLKITITE